MPTPATADPNFDPKRHEDPARRPGQPGAEDQPARPGAGVWGEDGPPQPDLFDERQIPLDRRMSGGSDSAATADAPPPERRGKD